MNFADLIQVDLVEFLEYLQQDHSRDLQSLDIPAKYKECDIHIALERADNDENEEAFHKILSGFPLLKKHIELTSGVFTWKLTPPT